MNDYKIDACSAPPLLISGGLKMGGVNPKGERLGFNNYYPEKNGRPYIPISGEFHFSRYPYLYWEEEIVKMKLAGIDIIPTYLFWIYHEEEEGRFDWSGNNNLRYFVDLCAKHEMYVILRIGPFAHGECRNGGFPDWLYGRPFEVRTSDAGYLWYVKRYYQEIGKQVKGQLYKEGGPIIGVQLENEFMAASAKWEPTNLQGDEWIHKGSGGAGHLRILKQLALEAGFDVPLFTCTGWGKAPILEGETLPMWGGYAFQPWLRYWNLEIACKHGEHPPTDNYLFRDYHRNHPQCLDASYPTEQYPFACCEMGSGMQSWYNSRFIVPPESVTAMVINRVAGGCNFIGYYMFHGGSSAVGKHTYLNERCIPKISYDFQAPLGEFGQMKDSYRHLKPFHYFCRDFAELLGPMTTVLPDNAAQVVPSDSETLRYAVRVNGNAGFLFLTNYQDHATVKSHENIRITVKFPAEELTVPAHTGFDLKENVSAILPLNLNLAGVLVKYATTQLVTSLEHDDDPYYFFFSPEGIVGEYCLDAGNITAITVENGCVTQREKQTYIKVNPDMQCLVNISLETGKKVHICTLTSQQMLQFWKIELWGRDRVIITGNDIMTGDGYLELRNRNSAGFRFLIFPDVKEALQIDGITMKKSTAGIFSRYAHEFPGTQVTLDWQKAASGKAVIKLPQEVFNTVNELFLRVDYRGDVGNAFLNGRLIHDHFCNGEIWEIGLKRFYPAAATQEFYLSVAPLRKGHTVYSDASLAIGADFVGEEIAEIHAIELVAEYRGRVVRGL